MTRDIPCLCRETTHLCAHHHPWGWRPRSLRSRPIAVRLPGGRSVGMSSVLSLIGLPTYARFAVVPYDA
jgi:hypothetical protein